MITLVPSSTLTAQRQWLLSTLRTDLDVVPVALSPAAEPKPIDTDPSNRSDVPELSHDLRLVPAAVMAWWVAWWACAAPLPVLSWMSTVGALLAGSGCGALWLRQFGARDPVVWPARPQTARLRAGTGRPATARLQWGSVLGLRMSSTFLASMLLVLVVATGVGISTCVQSWFRHIPALANLVGSRSFSGSVTVTSVPTPVVNRGGIAATRSPPRLWLTATVQNLTVGSASDHAAPATRTTTLTRALPVTLFVPDTSVWRNLAPGSRITLAGTITSNAPGEQSVAVLQARTEPRVTEPLAWWWQAAHQFRMRLRQAVTGWPAPARDLLPSLAIGDTTQLSPQVVGELQRSGLTHLTAVSGANITLVTGAVVLLLQQCRLRRRAIALAGMVMVGAYVLVTGPQPSVVRAAVMAVFVLVGWGVLEGRQRNPVPVLAASVIVIVLVDPWWSRSLGFALSVAATAALLMLAPRWAAAAERGWLLGSFHCRLPGWLALALAVPAAAQFACTPFLLLVSPHISVVALLANLLVASAVAPATIAALVAALLGWCWPVGAHLIAGIGCLAAWFICSVASWTAAIPGATVTWFSGTTAAFAAAGGLGLLLAVLPTYRWVVSHRSYGLPLRSFPMRADGAPAQRTRRHRHRADQQQLMPRPSRWRLSVTRRRWLSMLVTMIMVGGALVILWWSRWLPVGSVAPGAGPWVVAMCDVGQGDAMLIRSGTHRAVLIDAGPDADRVDACLRQHQVSHLDLVLLTHDHADHVGGLSGVVRDRQVAQVVVNALPVPATTQQRQAVVRAAGVPSRVVQAGESAVLPHHDGWQVSWQVLHTGSTVPPSAGSAVSGYDESSAGSVINEASTVTALQVRDPAGRLWRIVNLADAELATQQTLAQSGRLGPVDIVKVAHHGSAKQNPAVYQDLQPAIALVGVGESNDYGHPAPRTVRLLQQTARWIGRTDRHHTIDIGMES